MKTSAKTNFLAKVMEAPLVASRPYPSSYAWTPWANLGGSVANFEIVSTDWASLYVDSFTVEYVVKTLK